MLSREIALKNNHYYYYYYNFVASLSISPTENNTLAIFASIVTFLNIQTGYIYICIYFISIKHESENDHSF